MPEAVEPELTAAAERYLAAKGHRPPPHTPDKYWAPPAGLHEPSRPSDAARSAPADGFYVVTDPAGVAYRAGEAQHARVRPQGKAGFLVSTTLPVLLSNAAVLHAVLQVLGVLPLGTLVECLRRTSVEFGPPIVMPATGLPHRLAARRPSPRPAVES